MSMYALTNVVKPYAWGSLDAIPRLLGTAPTGDPQAELWIGAHPSGPSTARMPGGYRSLIDVVAADPPAMLGAAVSRRFNGALPFLLKILSAAAPLSLQVHPSKKQAETGYAAENAAGVALDAPTRNYKDANHKPELLLAMTPFEALCGFRPPRETSALLLGLPARAGGELDGLVEMLLDDDEGRALRTATEMILTLDGEAAAAAVEELVSRCQGVEHPSARTAIDLHRVYPGDAGVILSMLLNRVSLSPGEAIFLPAGNMHAYLHGTGVEIMATSDNVLRGGLTPKHIDVPELLAVVDFTPMVPAPYPAGDDVEGVVDYDVPVDDFRLSVLTLVPDRVFRWDAAAPRAVIVLEGRVTLTGAGGSLTLLQGESAFIAAADAPVTIEGRGQLVVAATGT